MRIAFFIFLMIATQFGGVQIGEPQSCPFFDSEKEVIENAIQSFVLDSLFAAEFSGIEPNGFPSKGHLAYASTLLGQIRSGGVKSDPGVRESASLTELCTAPVTFEPVCRSEGNEPAEDRFWKEHDVCVQISCEAKGMYRANIRWSPLPNGESRKFTYSAVKKREITYLKNPDITWRFNDTIPRRLIVTGDFFSTAEVVIPEAKKIRATYTGDVTVVVTERDGIDAFILHMTFPGLRSLTPARADLLLHHHDQESAEGTISVGEIQLASLQLRPGEPLKITWTPACK